MIPFGWLGAAAIAVSLVLAPGANAAQRVHGLVIGIDEYIHAPLHGAVNDARDVAGALETLGADVTLLLDGEATRDGIFAAWDAVIAKAAPGDLIVFSYAGHGGQEPEAVPGSEEDGKDETFLLGGFTPEAPGNAQRIRDDEINAMLRRASAQTVLFIADSCHSGTMTRAFAKTTKAGSRFMDYGAIADDQLPPPPSPPAGAKAAEGGFDNVVFMAGVADHLEVVEVTIDGKNRGALSYAAARGLRGDADLDGDGGISRSELESFVRATILAATRGAQQVQMEGTSKDGFLTAPKPITVAVADAGSADLREIQNALPEVVRVLPADDGTADLTWELAGGRLIGRQGFAVATLPPPAPAQRANAAPAPATRSFQRAAALGTAPAPDWTAQVPAVTGIASKWMLVDRLGGAARGRPIGIGLAPQAHLYREGQTITLSVDLQRERYLTLFNVGPAGDVNFLYPLAQYKDPPFLPEGRNYEVSADVHPPFGADHFIVVASREQPTHLQDMLTSLDRQILTPDTAATLAAEIRASGGRVGLIQATTAGKE